VPHDIDRATGRRSPSPANPFRFNLRRVVGGARLLLTEASPWRLAFQRRIGDLKADLVAEVADWPAVETAPHRYGGTEFLVGGREIGHVHDWGLTDIPFVRPVGEAVVTSGIAARHHVLPDSGWATTFLETPADRDRIRDLLWLSWCWHVANFDPTGASLDRASTEREVRALSLDESVTEVFLSALDSRA
jgi:hypothetical protein